MYIEKEVFNIGKERTRKKRGKELAEVRRQIVIEKSVLKKGRAERKGQLMFYSWFRQG